MKSNSFLFVFTIILSMVLSGCTIPVQVVNQPTQAYVMPANQNQDNANAVLMATISALETHVANLSKAEEPSTPKQLHSDTPAPIVPTETPVPSLTPTATAAAGVPVVNVTSIVPYQYNYGYPYNSQTYPYNYYPYGYSGNPGYSGYSGYYTACNRATFIRDVTVSDGTHMSQGAGFVKTWRLRNDGSCTWTTAYSLVFVQGSSMGAPTSTHLPVDVTPGMTIDLSINLVAPTTDGYYQGYWMLQDTSGSRFGVGYYSTVAFWVKIIVGSASPYNYYPPYPWYPH